jgi:hypothetical protein
VKRELFSNIETVATTLPEIGLVRILRFIRNRAHPATHSPTPGRPATMGTVLHAAIAPRIRLPLESEHPHGARRRAIALHRLMRGVETAAPRRRRLDGGQFHL